MASQVRKILDVVERLEQIGYRLTDRVVDDGDLAFINEQIEKLNEYLAQGLQSLIDDDEEQKGLAIALLAIGSMKPFLYYYLMRESRSA